MATVIERAVVKGTLLSSVQWRGIFTCEINYVGGDTRQAVWTPYIDRFYQALKGSLSTGWHITSYELFYRFAGQWVSAEEVAYTLSGLDATDAVANLIAGVLIGKAVGVRKVGRKFISGFTENQTTGNSFVAGTLTSLATALVDYITPMTTVNGSTLTPGILDKNEVFQHFVGGLVSQLIGTMRRRKPGLGI